MHRNAQNPKRIMRRLTKGLKRPSKHACWEWQGAKDKDGYGLIKVDGHLHQTHRLMFLLTHRLPLTSDVHVMHACDHPPCANPHHLQRGDRAANMADKARKGRARNQYTKGGTP